MKTHDISVKSRATGVSLKAASTSDRVPKFFLPLSQKSDRETPPEITRVWILPKKFKKNKPFKDSFDLFSQLNSKRNFLEVFRFYRNVIRLSLF
jgi:hypothetical protein